MLPSTVGGSPSFSRRMVALLAILGAAVCVLPTLRAGPAAAEDEEPPAAADAVDNKQTTPDAADKTPILEVKDIKVSPDANRITFSVDVAKGERFRVSLQEVSTRQRYLHDFIFENERDVPARVEVVFRYRKDSEGAKPDSALLSQQKWIGFEVDAEGCHPGGLTTSTAVPLSNLPASEKKLVIAKPEDDWGTIAPDRRRVLLIYPKSKASQKPAAITPRGELIVSWEPVEHRPTFEQMHPASQLATVWSRQTREIGTAHIRYSKYNNGSVHAVTREQVNEILAGARLDESAENLRGVFRKLYQKGATYTEPFGGMEFRSVGPKLRVDRRERSRVIGIRVIDLEIDLRWDPANKHINVNLPGQSRVGHDWLESFRLRSPLRRPGKDDVAIRPNGRVVVKYSADRAGDYELTADPSTGFIHRLIRRNGKGQVLQESFQYRPVQYPGKIIFPNVIATLTYRSGVLELAGFVVITSAEFNESFPADAFALSASAGTWMFDYRKDSFREATRRLPEDVTDLAAYIKEHYPVSE